MLNKEWIRGLLVALIIIGVGLAAISAQQFIDATLRLQDNTTYQTRSSGEEVTIESQTEALMLMGEGVEFQRLTAQRNNALIIGGVGLVILAVGWLGYDIARSKRRKLSTASQ